MPTGEPAARFVAASDLAPWSVEITLPHEGFYAPLLTAGAILALAVLGATLAGALGGHIAKPVDPAQLYAALLRVLLQRPATPAEGAPVAAALRHFPQIAGLDAELSRRYFSGRVDAFCRVLRQFASQYGGGLADLDRLLGQGELAVARLAVHSIKGASATLGAEQVPRLADALEKALAAGRPMAEIKLGAQALQMELAHLLEAIRSGLRPEDEASPHPVQ